MPGTKHGPSVKNPKQYEGLRDKSQPSADDEKSFLENHSSMSTVSGTWA